MIEHPYRSPARSSPPAKARSDPEQLILSAVLAIVGLVGIVVGVAAQGPLELVAGIALCSLASWTASAR